MDEELKNDLILPDEMINRLCLFLVPSEYMSFYRDNVYSIVRSYGFVPINSYDIISPGDNIMVKEQALFNKADIPWRFPNFSSISSASL